MRGMMQPVPFFDLFFSLRFFNKSTNNAIRIVSVWARDRGLAVTNTVQATFTFLLYADSMHKRYTVYNTGRCILAGYTRIVNVYEIPHRNSAKKVQKKKILGGKK